MDWQANPYVIPLVVVAGFAAVCAVLTFRQRYVVNSSSGAVLCGLGALWLLANALELASPTIETKVLWNKIQYVCLFNSAVATFTFAVSYTGHLPWLRPRLMALVTFVPVLAILLTLTNEQHGLIWQSSLSLLHQNPTFVFVRHIYGPAFYVAAAYSCSLLLFSARLLARAMHRAGPTYRLQLRVLLVAVCLPLLASVLDIVGVSERLGLDSITLCIAAATFLLAGALTILRRRASVTAARLEAMAALCDGLVITDENLNIIEINAAARATIGDKNGEPLGLPLGEVCPGLLDAQNKCGPDGLMGLKIDHGDDAVHMYEVRRNSVRDTTGKVMSNVYLFHDVTEDERLRGELSKRYEEAYQRSETDSLTGLLNHMAIHQRLDYELKRAQREEDPLSLIMIDLDGFKLLNDTYGHPIGDQALKEVASVLITAVRRSDIVGRYGGDEFVVILPATGQGQAVESCLRMQEAMRERAFVPISGQEPIPLKMSIGVATYPKDGTNVQELVSFADANLYESKRRGGDPVTSKDQTSGEVDDIARFALLEGFVTAIDSKDNYTRQHSEAVAEYALLMADEIGVSSEGQSVLRVAAMLHDLGKIGVSDKILRKPGPLNETEREVIERHPVLGELIIKEVPNLADVLGAVASHHERYDGTGYPRGLKGNQIPLLGRILAVADTYSAMTTDRPYRKSLSHERARSELIRVSGSQLDPQLVQAFLEGLVAECRGLENVG